MIPKTRETGFLLKLRLRKPPMSKTYSIDDLEHALRATLAPRHVAVRNDSEKHAGHGGYKAGVITHVHVEIESDVFAGKSRVAMHRMVNDALHAFFDQGLHALSIDARA